MILANAKIINLKGLTMYSILYEFRLDKIMA